MPFVADGPGSGRVWDGRHPGAAGDRVAENDQDVLPCLAAVEMQPRIAYWCLVVASERSRPGWSSIDGGNEELPLFREIRRSSRASRTRQFRDLRPQLRDHAVPLGNCLIPRGQQAQPLRP
jgi:hypothetical protein